MKLAIPDNWRSYAVFAFDLASVALAWCTALMLRFNFEWPDAYAPMLWGGAALLLPFEAVVFRAAGLYRGIWVFASLPDLLRIAKAVAVSMVGVAIGSLLLGPLPAMPRSVFFLYPVLLVGLMGGGRALYRIYKEHRIFGALQGMGKPVLVLGAGSEAANLVRQLCYSSEWNVVGILDDDPTKQRREICGVRVLGTLSQLNTWAAELKVRHAIIAMPAARRSEHRQVANLCVRAGVKVFTLPNLNQMIAGHDPVSQIRKLNVEDLLGRDPVSIDSPELRQMLAGRVVMVTGAGGSIGSELCRQIARFGPALLLAFDASEYALYRLNEDFHEVFPEVSLLPLAGDVKDHRWVTEIMARHVPAVVFHAAAYKHVPLMEENNAWQAVRNNAFGTWVVAQAAAAAGVGRFVLVSTDKAVNPTNVMGASKRLAEMICQAMQAESRTTRFEIVRFGNVLGSTGSVIPKFQAQIERGGPITVTHPDITRYFMAITEAARLVLLAGAMGEGGEIFVLDMGEPVRVLDLARDMVRLSGYAEDEIPIVFTGLRAGEKLYEEVLADREKTRPTGHPQLRVAKAYNPDDFELRELLQWIRASHPRSDAEVRRDLRRWVPEYLPYNPPKPYLIADREHRQA